MRKKKWNGQEEIFEEITKINFSDLRIVETTDQKCSQNTKKDKDKQNTVNEM